MAVGYCFIYFAVLISDKINGDLCHVLSPFYYYLKEGVIRGYCRKTYGGA